MLASTIVPNRSTVNFVTTVTMPGFTLAPIQPRRDLLELVIRLLLWLLALAITLRGNTQTGCCDKPKVKSMGGGWYWCTNCGSRWQESSATRQRLYTELDYSLKIGHNLDWRGNAYGPRASMKRES